MLKDPYKEISEEIAGINNKAALIRILRIFIRYLTRIFGFKVSANILSIFSKLKFKQNRKLYNYLFYIIKLNAVRNRHLHSIKKDNFINSLETKVIWANFQLNNSLSARARWSARNYLNLLSRYDLYRAKIPKINNRFKSSNSDKKYYIYGPTAATPPTEDYNNYSLILTKPLAYDLSSFRSKMLYLNSIYYQNKVLKNFKLQNELFENFQEIYVSCRTSPIEEPFKKAPFPIGDNLCGPMALGRILYHLRSKDGIFDLVIEGFDLYLESDTYKSYYPSLARTNQNQINEYLVVKSLSDHDALFNFLYVKDILDNLNIKGSSDFLEILKMSPMEYLEELSRVRDASLL